jgi:Domain of unknown function (DUF4440)
MRRAASIVLSAALAAAGCGADRGAATGANAPAAQARSAEEDSVRAFVHAVAAAVSREGPGAWRRAFADGPEFLMAVNGQLVFPDAAAAARGIEALTHTLPKIELRFGDDLRVDVLTGTFALVGSSYAEVQTDAQGRQHTDRGYFTGLAERRDGQWRLRSAHWSSLPP